MRLGYNTNGMQNHQLADAIELLAEIGYRSVAITVDHHALNPFSPNQDVDFTSCVDQVAAKLNRVGFSCVVETGARFLLDPRQKHEPTLVSPTLVGRGQRVDFLKRCIDIAATLGADAMSCWSGVVHDDATEEETWSRLIDGLRDVSRYAAEQGVAVGFEPEPGMFIDTMQRFRELNERLGADAMKLTLDVGHLQCLGEPIVATIEEFAGDLVNVHIEDMLAGVHEHLMFGEGEMDFPPILRALSAVGYDGGVHVELSRHSHAAPTVAQQSYDFLSGYFA